MMLLKKPIKEEFEDKKENRQPESQFITYQQLSKQLQENRLLAAQSQNNDSYPAYPDSASIQLLTLTNAGMKKDQNNYTEYEIGLEKMRQRAKAFNNRLDMGIDNGMFKKQDKLIIKKLQEENNKLKNENMRLQNENKNLKVKLKNLIVRPYFQLPPKQKYKDKLREYFKLPNNKKLKTANALSSSSQQQALLPSQQKKSYQPSYLQNARRGSRANDGLRSLKDTDRFQPGHQRCSAFADM